MRQNQINPSNISNGRLACPILPFLQVNATEPFWEHTIRDDQDFETHVNYVHINPVKHGHVARAIDWPHSTIHRYVERGLMVADWACTPEKGDFGE